MCPHRWAPPRRRSPLHLSRCSSCHAQSPGPARHLYICHADGLVMRNPRVRRVNCRWSGAIDRSHSNCEAVFRPQTLRCEEAPVRAQSKRSPLIQTAKLGRKGGRALRRARGIRRPTVMPHPQARGRVKATKGYSNTVCTRYAHGMQTAARYAHGGTWRVRDCRCEGIAPRHVRTNTAGGAGILWRRCATRCALWRGCGERARQVPRPFSRGVLACSRCTPLACLRAPPALARPPSPPPDLP